VERLDLQRDLPGLDPDSTLYGDIQRFIAFSDGFAAIAPAQPSVIGDLRYSMLPASTRPLWGLVVDPGRPEAHAEYRFFREQTPALRRTFINMLWGRCAAAVC
jgi:inner membrane protein